MNKLFLLIFPIFLIACNNRTNSQNNQRQNDSSDVKENLLPTNSSASEKYCTLNGNRFKKAVFNKIDTATATYLTIDDENLKIKIFQPENDTLDKRPLVIYVHGGGFKSGNYDHPGNIKFCMELAKLGYVSATISYRLTLKGQSFHCDCPAEKKIKTFEYAVNDLRAATKFILKNSEKYSVDTTKIILIGSSAGAETILHTCFWANNTKNENEQWLSNEFQYAGLVPLAGAMIDTLLITPKNSIPIMLFHGTCDPLVPYGSATHHFCPDSTPGALLLHGSHSIMQRYDNLKKTYYLYTACGEKHGINYTPISNNFQEIITFFHDAVLCGKYIQKHQIEKGTHNCNEYGNADFCND